jgi:hypothetical protein
MPIFTWWWTHLTTKLAGHDKKAAQLVSTSRTGNHFWSAMVKQILNCWMAEFQHLHHVRKTADIYIRWLCTCGCTAGRSQLSVQIRFNLKILYGLLRLGRLVTSNQVVTWQAKNSREANKNRTLSCCTCWTLGWTTGQIYVGHRDEGLICSA